MDLLGPGAEAIARSVPSWYGMAAAAALLSLLIGSVTCKAYGRDPSAVGTPSKWRNPPGTTTLDAPLQHSALISLSRRSSSWPSSCHRRFFPRRLPLTSGLPPLSCLPRASWQGQDLYRGTPPHLSPQRDPPENGLDLGP